MSEPDALVECETQVVEGDRPTLLNAPAPPGSAPLAETVLARTLPGREARLHAKPSGTTAHYWVLPYPGQADQGDVCLCQT